jgi:hypothetical protein
MKLTMTRLIQIFLIASFSCAAQPYQLKSVEHGLKLMLTDMPKEKVLDEIRFDKGKNTAIDAIRFDHVAPTSVPLIISSETAVATDSLGIRSFKLNKEDLADFLDMIHHVNPKSSSRKIRDDVLIRATYRYAGELSQYYMTDSGLTSSFFIMIEQKLRTYKEPGALELFYQFVEPTGLRVEVNGKKNWKY